MTDCHVKKVHIGRLRTKIQFEHVLAQSRQIHSIHFALHYSQSHLSTDSSFVDKVSVDKYESKQSRFGLIIPKRWARRAVTRSLIKRQCRAEFRYAVTLLPIGDWVIRLRRSFDQAQWTSGASVALRQCVRQELQALLQCASHVCTGRSGVL